MQARNLTTPTGRLVAGDVYRGNDKDAEGKPRVIKNGPNAGQPAVQFFYALAIQKTPGKQWWEEPWGALIFQAGAEAFPNAYQSPAFAWKVTDGDSQIPNKRGKKPCDQEGYKGCWVLKFTSGFAPTIHNANGSERITAPDAVKLGYYVQIAGNVVGNGSPNQPGVFLNGSMIALQGYGPEIIVGPDASQVGFGQGPLPAGASAVPLGAMSAAGAPGTPAMPGAPAAPGAAAPMPGAPAIPGAVPSTPVLSTPASAPAVPTVAVTPNPAFAGMPAAAGVPAVPGAPAVPAAPVRRMTAAAQGASYEQMIANGWNDQLLIQHGMMLP